MSSLRNSPRRTCPASGRRLMGARRGATVTCPVCRASVATVDGVLAAHAPRGTHPCPYDGDDERCFCREDEAAAKGAA